MLFVHLFFISLVFSISNWKKKLLKQDWILCLSKWCTKKELRKMKQIEIFLWNSVTIDGETFIVLRQMRSFSCNMLRIIVYKTLWDWHYFAEDSSVCMNLFQQFEDVNSVTVHFSNIIHLNDKQEVIKHFYHRLNYYVRHWRTICLH